MLFNDKILSVVYWLVKGFIPFVIKYSTYLIILSILIPVSYFYIFEKNIPFLFIVYSFISLYCILLIDNNSLKSKYKIDNQKVNNIPQKNIFNKILSSDLDEEMDINGGFTNSEVDERKKLIRQKLNDLKLI